MKYTEEQLRKVDELLSSAGVFCSSETPSPEHGVLAILNRFIQDGIEILLCSDDPDCTENPQVYVEKFEEGKFKDSLGVGNTLPEALFNAAVNYCDRR